jgi:hypothetical protein
MIGRRLLLPKQEKNGYPGMNKRTAPVNAPRLIETYAANPVRMWTVPIDGCVAFPTNIFYHNRLVAFSNEGNPLYPRWLALDRYNDEDWQDHKFETKDLSPIFYKISTKECGAMRSEPTIIPPPRAPLMPRLARFLVSLVD